MIRNKRKTGFELLRIIAMFFIGAVHVMNYGQLIKLNSGGAVVLQGLIYGLFSVSVNVFVLISAFFMVNSKPSAKKILKLWFQVFMYSTIFYLIANTIMTNNFNILDFISHCLPVLCNKYWFFTTYFFLYLASPLLNKILHNSSKKELYIYCISLLVLAWLSTYFPIRVIMPFSLGYSFIWFVCLYMIAGTLKLHPIHIKRKALICVYIYLLIISWIVSLSVIFLYDYSNPIVALMSIIVFLLFKDIDIRNNFLHNTITHISSLTFGIYLLQESEIQPYLYFTVMRVQTFYHSPYSPLAVLMYAFFLFVVGAVVELIRQALIKVACWLIKKIRSHKQHNKEVKNS